MFELEIDFQKNEEAIWLVVVIALLVSTIVGMAAIGRGVTAVDNAGGPQILSWSGWRLLQAQRAYDAELSILRNDADQVALLVDQRPNPVAAQLLVETVARHTKSGDPSLANARTALSNAALNVRDWSTGVLDRNTAIQSVQAAFTLLQ